MNVLGYYEDDSKNPIGYLNNKGIIVFSNDSILKQSIKLGNLHDLHTIISNINYYKKISYCEPQKSVGKTHNRKYSLNPSLSGGGGFFGESDGKCGWGNSPSCCFYDCQPLWRTNVWPLNISM